MGKNKGGGKPSGGGGGGSSNGSSSSNGYGGGAGPSKPKRPKSGSKLDNRYLYAACALAFAVAAVGFQQFVATSEPPEPPVPEAARSKPARKAKSEAAPPRKRAPPPPPPMGAGRIDPGCVDDHENCEYWAKSGECDNNKAFMHSSCKASCHICNGGKPKPRVKGACEDTNENCATWAAIGECQSNPGFMLQNCPVTCKMCQSETCRDEMDDCAERCRGPATSNFSESFHCYSQPELVQKCAWTCGACKEHRFDRPECARPKDVLPGVGAPGERSVGGSVNEIFNRIVETHGEKVQVYSSEPWLIQIHDFLSHAECDEIVDVGSQGGQSWQRSMAGDGVQASRTSSTAWCGGQCAQNPTIRAVEQRVSDLLGGIPMENAEPMQMLRYETGQFYKTHHDQNSPRASAWGPRMFTVFMYVGDGYEGGLTNFPVLNVTVPARKGSAAVWTSVLDSDPYQRDDRTDHQALPVESGVKFGVNYWIHMFPFRTKQTGTCGNQAYIQNWY